MKVFLSIDITCIALCLDTLRDPQVHNMIMYFLSHIIYSKINMRSRYVDIFTGIVNISGRYDTNRVKGLGVRCMQ